MKTLAEQYIIDANGKKTGIILSLERYQQLLEDLHDLAIIAERRDEKAISLKALKLRLKENELI